MTPSFVGNAPVTEAPADIRLIECEYDRPGEAVERYERPVLSFTLPGPNGIEGSAAFEVDGFHGFQPLGELIFIPADSPLHAKGAGGLQRFLICEFDPATFAEVTGLCELQPDQLRRCLDIRNSDIRMMLQRVLREIVQPGFGTEIFVQSAAMMILVQLGRHLLESSIADDVGTHLADWQLRKIREHLNDAKFTWPSVMELAQLCGVSRCHLSRSFSRSTGTTLSYYARTIRIARATDLLKQPTYRIGEISNVLGFSSVGAFSAAFKRETGLSPRELRQGLNRPG